MVSKFSVIPRYIDTELISAKHPPRKQSEKNLIFSYFSTESFVFEGKYGF